MAVESELTVDRMAQRLDRVERESRRLRWLILGAFILGAIALGLSQGVLDRTRTISAGILLFELAINLNIAKALGSMCLPRSSRGADEVIE
jgi:hypothetical protein